MYLLEIQWNSEGPWLPTVYPPQPYDKALQMQQEHQARNREHTYRIFPTGASK